MEASEAEESPFHEGERSVQSRAGVRDMVEQIGRRIVRDHMPDQHRELFEKLPLVFVGTIDREGRPWASVVCGQPGFVQTPDARTMLLTTSTRPGDPALAEIEPGAPIGLLGIQLETRRRNRMNGTVVERSASGFSVHVKQSFGNCPKYIQARAPSFTDEPTSSIVAVDEGTSLSERSEAVIASADTFFIASASRHPDAASRGDGVDVSHRGGRPGFVKVERRGSETLHSWPDFEGNYLFNTLGNLAVHPHAGLLFVDFERGDLLSITSDTEVEWEGERVAAFAGAQRVLRARVVRAVRFAGALPLRWSAAIAAREIAATGSWDR